MADPTPADMLAGAMRTRTDLAKAGVVPWDMLNAKLRQVQAEALISIADSLARIATEMEADRG